MNENSSIPLCRVPGASSFPVGIFDDCVCTSVNYPYLIAATPVTYSLWAEVSGWAAGHGYFFENEGGIGSTNSGSEQQPVTSLSWRDAVVACNALTEYFNMRNDCALSPAYKYNGDPVRDSREVNTDIIDNISMDTDADGFRLPTSMEWELAAKYIDGTRWCPGNHVSGARGNYQNRDASTEVAWYEDNSIGTTHPVGLLKPNPLGLYDMSGNVWEWCFDRYGDFHRIARGGSCYDVAFVLQTGFAVTCGPEYAHNSFGFRPVRIIGFDGTETCR